MENFTLNTIVDYAKNSGYKKIIGEYLPTQKNGMVSEHYSNLGFTRMAGSSTAQWELDVEDYKNRECYINFK